MRFAESDEVLANSKLLYACKDYIEIVHDGFVSLIPVRVIERVSAYSAHDIET